MKYILVLFLLCIPYRILIADDSLSPNYPPPTVRQMVEEEFKDAPVMVKVAQAESKFNPLAKNPSSSAKGVYQFLDGTWKWYGCEGDVLNAEDNIACARIAYDKNGTNDWLASKGMW